MTTIYFVRHVEPNYNNHDDLRRELTAKGLKDRELVTEFLKDKAITKVLSSPYERSIHTIKHFADQVQLPIELVEDFRERKIHSEWIEDFKTFSRRQWEDFSYKLTEGESLEEVQVRNIHALKQVLTMHIDQNVVIGSHGTALSTIIHYFDNTFGYDHFEKIKGLMPWIVKFTFEGEILQGYGSINVFENKA